jgi:lipoprotein-releasing system permease protein
VLKVKGEGEDGSVVRSFKKVGVEAVDPVAEAETTDFGHYLQGVSPEELAALSGDGGLPWLVAGAELVKNPRVSVGSEVSLLIPRELGEYDNFSFRLAGTIRTGIYEYDANHVYIPIEASGAMRGAREMVVRLEPDVSPEVYTTGLQAWLDSVVPDRQRLVVETSDERYGPILTAIQLQVRLSAIVLLFYFLVAGVAVFAIMTMVVAEKTRDMGVVRAVGGSARGITSAFLLYGLTTGLAGVIVGTAAGRLALERLDWLRHQVLLLTGIDLFPRELYNFDALPWTFDPQLVAMVAAAALTAALLSSLYPAWSGARLKPVESLRYE